MPDSTALEPTVIDEDLCRRCVGKLQPPTERQGEGSSDAKKETAQREIKYLMFSYKNILKIDNLVGFDKLVKLQLDNNIIETIENLDHLQCLEWLDLSFNNISEISGLTALTQLTNLSLFSNRVTKLEGMDTLLNLEVLSVGNNLIRDLNSVMYLRPFQKLQAVNFVGNPFCQEPEYRPVLSHLKWVKYLDYRLVRAGRRRVEGAVAGAAQIGPRAIRREHSAARLAHTPPPRRYQEELLEMEETEQADEATAKHAAERAERQAKHAAAGLPDMEVLFDEVMLKAEDGSTSKVATLVQFAEPLQATGAILRKFRRNSAQFGAHSLTPRPYAAGLPRTDRLGDRYLRRRRARIAGAKERAQLRRRSRARAQSAAEAMGEIAKYSALKKRTLRDPSAPGGGGRDAHAGERRALRVTDGHRAVPSRAPAAIMAFEVAYDGLSKKTSEATQAFFNSARDMETAYHEEMVAVGTMQLAENEAELDALSRTRPLPGQGRAARRAGPPTTSASRNSTRRRTTRAIEEKN